MLVRRELAGDVPAVRALTAAAFARPDAPGEPVEVVLLDELRADPGWLPVLSLVAVHPDGAVVGHVAGSHGQIGDRPVLAIGPVSVHPDQQRRGYGSAMMHALLGAADALGEPLAVLLGAPGYYRRFGFRSAAQLGIAAPEPAWGEYFQARALTAYDPAIRGPFRYPAPFDRA